MANPTNPNKDPQNAPFGLRPVRRLDGASWNGATNEYSIMPQSPPIFFGDPVVFSSRGGGFIEQMPTTDQQPILGVMQGCKYTDLQGKAVTERFWPGGSKANVDPNKPVTAFVCDDPMVLFEVMTSTDQKQVGAITQGLIGKDFDIMGLLSSDTGGAPDPAPPATKPAYGQKNPGPNLKTGTSGGYLDVSSTSELLSDVKAVFLTPKPNNVYPSGQFSPTNMVGAYNTALVLIDNHVFKSTQAHPTSGKAYVKLALTSDKASFPFCTSFSGDTPFDGTAINWDSAIKVDNWPGITSSFSGPNIKLPKTGTYNISLQARMDNCNEKINFRQFCVLLSDAEVTADPLKYKMDAANGMLVRFPRGTNPPDHGFGTTFNEGPGGEFTWQFTASDPAKLNMGVFLMATMDGPVGPMSGTLHGASGGSGDQCTTVEISQA